jgi:hypothetical protein
MSLPFADAPVEHQEGQTMKLPGSIILVGTLVAAAAIAAVTPVGAAERLSDVAFMNASRCAGLAEGAKIDSASIKAFLEAQRGSRDSYIQDKAEEMRDDAAREARHAGGTSSQRIAAELDGACKTYVGAATVAKR